MDLVPPFFPELFGVPVLPAVSALSPLPQVVSVSQLVPPPPSASASCC